MRSTLGFASVCIVSTLLLSLGCSGRNKTHYPGEAASGIYARDVFDPVAQTTGSSQGTIDSNEKYLIEAHDKRKAEIPLGKKPRNVLCLSGGGALGAYSAGVLCAWTSKGDRPTFDVVTGISTGALIAPFAFLGPKYDEQMKQFYTTLSNDDIYKKRIARAILFGEEGLADNQPLSDQIDKVFTSEVMAELAAAHAQGRHLYVGTTLTEGRRFIVWDITEIAARNGPCDRVLIRQILLGSSAIPGFFPPAKIDVTVDGKRYTERHSDGGTVVAIFFRPPYVPEELRNDKHAMNYAGTQVWALVAGKLWPDPVDTGHSALAFAGKSVSTMLYAGTRNDLFRIYTKCMLNGVDFHLTAIPSEYTGSDSSADFNPVEMTKLFNEGYRVVCSGTAWRPEPPGARAEEGETWKFRNGTNLAWEQKGPVNPIKGPKDKQIPPYFGSSDSGIPVVPLIK